MVTNSGIVAYYSARAGEYENVYAKPERQDDLRQLHELIPALFSGRRVLDVACGTGYWTRLIAAHALATIGCDLSTEVLALARDRQPADAPADFVVGDAFALGMVPGDFDAAFVGFWWSHILRADLSRFLGSLHRRLPGSSRIVLLDNRYVPGSNWPITRTDETGNTYQRRRLDNGAEHEVLKNFPSPDELHAAITAAGGGAIEVREFQYYWCAIYEAGGKAGGKAGG